MVVVIVVVVVAAAVVVVVTVVVSVAVRGGAETRWRILDGHERLAQTVERWAGLHAGREETIGHQDELIGGVYHVHSSPRSPCDMVRHGSLTITITTDTDGCYGLVYVLGSFLFAVFSRRQSVRVTTSEVRVNGYG